MCKKTILCGGLAACFLLIGCTTAPAGDSFAAAAGKGDITAVSIVNEADAQANLPVTFALPFVRGAVPVGETLTARLSNGAALPTQVDAKATNPDATLRHAIVTVVLPKLGAGDSDTIVLAPVRPHASTRKSVTLDDLPQDFDAAVKLTLDGKTYSASARTLLKQGSTRQWLHGPIVSEWIVRGPLVDAQGKADPYLAAQFAIRCYRSGEVRVAFVVENDWTYVPAPHAMAYAAALYIGGKQVYANDRIVQYAQTRWRKVYWFGGTPDTFVRFDSAYLKATDTIPNYAPELQVSQTQLAHMAARLAASDTDPGGVGLVHKGMPAAGGRGDIGPLPRWTAMFLTSMDPRAWAVTKANADLSGSWPIHYRDRKTGRPLSLDNHPRASAHYMLKGQHDYSIPKIAKRQPGIPRSDLRPNTAHEPSLTFVPYLLTGDYYYLEELQFWAAYNSLMTSPGYRDYSKGLLHWLPVRGQAWAMRALAQTAYITPDDDPMKGYWTAQLDNNLEYYSRQYADNPDANPFHAVLHIIVYNHGRGIAPWQNDYFAWTIGYIAQLGYEKAEPMWRWQAQFAVNRMLAPGYCYVYGSIYSLNIRDSRHTPLYKTFAQAYDASVPDKARDAECGSAAMASVLGRNFKPGDMYGYPWSPQGYPAVMQPALASAVDAGIPGADKAWKLFMSRPTKPDYSSYPNWDIVPRDSQPNED
jgi:hypothetical protein